MKIISKYKDYYDYLQGIYGIDNKIILDRREGEVFNIDYLKPYRKNTYTIIKLAICNELICVAIDYNGRTYCGKSLANKLVYKYSHRDNKLVGSLPNEFNDHITIHTDLEYTDLNTKCNCPIIGLNLALYGGDIVKFPRLSDFNIASMYSAEQIFKDLYTWIEEHKIIDKPDNRTDIEKIISAGFDKKTSFRKM